MPKHLNILIVVGVLATIYFLTAPSQITLEDAGIFQMTCQLGGISHPPGYPLFTAFCQSLPYGDTALVGNLISTLFALGAVIALYGVIREMQGESSLAAMAALAYGLTQCFWSQAIIIEVYSLAAFLFLVCWWLLLRFINTSMTRYWWLLCFAAGLSISNHWPLFILSCLGFVSIAWRFWPRFVALLNWRHILLSLIAFLLGLMPYLQLFQIAPEIALYGPVGWENLKPYFLREYYSDDFIGALPSDKLQYLLWLFPLSLQQLGWVALPFVLLGLVTTPKRLGLTHFVSLVAVFFASTFVLILLLNFRFEFQTRAVFMPYPVIAVASIAVFFAVGLEKLTNLLSRVRRGLGMLLVTGVFAVILVSNFIQVDRSKSKLAAEYARIVLEAMPENAILLVGGDNQIGPIGFTSRIQGVRPDVTVYNKDGLLFRDNLLPRHLSDVERIERLSEFKRTSGRRIFTTHQLTTEDVDYGLFFEFRGSGPRQVLLPAVSRFTQYLVEINRGGFIRDAHETVFAHSLLVGLSGLYSQYAFEFGIDQMPEENRLTLIALQETLPGKLGSLRALTASNPAAEGLLELALSLEAQLGESVANQHDALAYEFIGRLFVARGEDNLAQDYFFKSLAKYPDISNGAVCEWLRRSAPEQRDGVAKKYQLDFTECVKQSG